MPITRYATHLKLRGEYDRYMELLESNFNAATLRQVMCRNLISIGWDGSVYDCDFNQMLDMPIPDAAGNRLAHRIAGPRSSSRAIYPGRRSLLRLHRGSGSSCGGDAGSHRFQLRWQPSSVIAHSHCVTLTPFIARPA